MSFLGTTVSASAVKARDAEARGKEEELKIPFGVEASEL